jgi:hypothetical protein
MASPWSVDDLEIAGYSNVLKAGMLPSVVPPVFRLKSDPNRVFLPPYSFNAGFLCNATEVSQSELEELSESNEITLFDRVLPAQAGFELWIDEEPQPHYEPSGEAHGELSRIATAAIKDAQESLQRGRLDEAERLAGVAISADDKRVEPLAIKAAIRRARGKHAGERLMAELAAPTLEERLFKLLVDDYCRSAGLDQSAAPPTAVPHRPMQGMACLRSWAA